MTKEQHPLSWLDPIVMTAINETLSNREFMQNYDRLNGTCFTTRRSPIEIMVDKATGKRDDDVQRLLEFVCAYVVRPWLEKMVRDGHADELVEMVTGPRTATEQI